MTSNGSFDEETTSSEILCSEILCRIPFKKTLMSGETVQIDSKNQVEEEDALQLEQWIQNQEVFLSHSSTMQLQEHCRGVVEEFEYEKKNLKVTVSSETGFSIWEDTDIWMFSLSTPTSSVCTTEPNTSADTEPPMAEDKPIDQSELFESINGWKVIGTKRERLRRKEDGRWRNVYLLELEMTCVDPEKRELLEHIEERTALRLSDDIEEPGVVLVDVIRKCMEQKTITVGVTGFLSRDVRIPLTPETTYYLNIYDIEDDDMGSMASEDGILPGYPLVQNLDELCEKVGELTITDVCARVWYTDNTDLCYIRLLVTSLKNMANFKRLTGHYVIVTSLTNDGNRAHVLGVVNRVFNEEMVLTLKGVPRHSKEFFFSKKEGLTIQIAHEYTERVSQEKGDLEKLRFDLANSSTDIRFERYWKETINGFTRNYASFTVKNEEFLRIPIDTRIIIGKCYDLNAPVEKKAGFAIAKRVKHVHGDAELTLVFELINSRLLVEDSEHIKISKAFYYLDFDSSDDMKSLPESSAPSLLYCLLNARNAKDPEDYTLAKKNPIGKEFKFFVFPYDEKFQAKNQSRRKKNQQLKAKSVKPSTPVNNNNNPPVWSTKKPPKQDGLKRFSPHEFGTQHSEDPRSPKTEVSKHTGKESWTTNLQCLPQKAKRLCFVRFPDPIRCENQTPIINLRTGFNEKGETVKTSPFRLGSRVAVTAGVEQKEIRIRGDVIDTDGEIVTIQVDRKLSDMEFLFKLKKSNNNNKNRQQQKPVFPCFEVR